LEIGVISKLAAANFKSWRYIPEMPFAPITGLFGSNSSGKSAILELLLLMKQTAESSDRSQILNFGDERDPVALGGYRDVIFAHKTSEPLSWSIQWKQATPLRVVDPKSPSRDLFTDDSFLFETQLGYRARRAYVERMTYMFSGIRFSMVPKAQNMNEYKLEARPASSFKFKRTRGRAWPLPPPLKFYGFPDQVKAYYQNAAFLSDLELAFEHMLRGTFYLGPLREEPQRQYLWSGAQPEDVGYRGERAIDALLAARAQKRTISRGKGRPLLTLQQYVAMWLRDLGLISSFSVAGIGAGGGTRFYQVRVRHRKGTPEVLLPDIGFGISQVLPVLVLCYYVPRGSTVLLEQPELHLHPAVQAGLADVFIDAMKRRRIQIVFESHSEHLLNRLQLRLAEEKLSPDNVELYFCKADGESRLERLELDIFGNISNWPDDFFGDPLHEGVARLEAEAKRRRTTR
jgi:hypothetical protein